MGSRSLCVISAAAAICALTATAAAAVTIDLVPVGNPGNAADPIYGFGRVDYDYQIGKYEITQGQYTEFLNAVAATDTYALYDVPNVTQLNQVCGIVRSGVSGSYGYSVTDEWKDRAVPDIGFFDALRFVNWLENGQPVGPQGPGTTETGSYALPDLSGMTPLQISDTLWRNTVVRNPGAKWVVPTVDEWHKAAYYEQSTGHYYRYATRSDTIPGRMMHDQYGNNANRGPHYTDSNLAFPIDPSLLPGPEDDKYITKVGEFQNSPSPYGTFDQNGNVAEWAETIRPDDAGIGGTPVVTRYWLGSTYQSSDFIDLYPEPYYRQYRPQINNGDIGYGLRVAIVPEPTSMGLVLLTLAGLLTRRRES